ncbi:hypothetical protein DITRI_Ditri04bG0018300 [Diplodiscus trichospermus]
MVQWISEPRKTPWRLRRLVVQIENIKTKIKDWSISRILRESNDVANGLAKAGVHRETEVVLIYDG